MNFPVRVYYEDTDHGGVVYYANYLKFMERGRTEFLRSHHIELDTLQHELGILFVVTNVTIDYKSAAHFNDLLHVNTYLRKASGARIAFDQRIECQQSDGSNNILTDACVQLACVNNTGKPCPIPKSLLSILQSTITPKE